MLAIRKMILKRLVGDLLAKCGAVTVCSERGYDPDAKSFTDTDAAVQEALEFDECHIFTSGNHAEGYGPWVYVIFGNGNCDLDMISDYSTELEPVLKPINEWIGGIESGAVELAEVPARVVA
jgi:hypothetical protein